MKALPIKANGLACALLVALGTTLAAGAWGDDAASPSSSRDSSPTPASDSSDADVAPQSADQLDAIVAPIALYPDSLVAQVLSAAQFPDQVALADSYVTDNRAMSASDLANGVDQQTWDPSVKALTQFPSVLHDLATNLAWTSELGEAFHYQQTDVMASVQRLRAKAQAAGNLKSTTQIQVVQQSPQTIVIQPAKPDVVYVPQYNPAVVYGVPYVVPYYTPVYPYPVASAALSFGAGVVVGAAIGGGFNWGFHAWGLGWGGWGGGGGNTIIFNHNTYINRTTWNGNRYNWNGYHPWGPHQGPIGPGPHGGWTTHNAPGWDPHGGGWSAHGNWYPNGRGGYDWQRNGGDNGNHGLIGGNGGTYHPEGGNNGNDGQFGGNGGVWHPNGEGTPATNAMHPTPGTPGGTPYRVNGIGGETQHATAGAPDRVNGIGAERNGLGADRDNASADRNVGAQRSEFRSPERRSGWNGNGGAARAEQNRGRQSFHAMRAPHPAFHGGGGRRR